MKTTTMALIAAALLLLGCTQPASPSPQPSMISTGGSPIMVLALKVAPTATPTLAITQTAQPTASATDSATPAVKEFTMTAENWKFTPDTITVKKGDMVKLAIRSVDVEHGFALPDFAVSVNLQPGQQATAEFTADKAGTFTFFCSVFCGEGHRDMKGQLIVEP